MNEAKYREAETRLWNAVGHSPIEKMITLGTTKSRVRVQAIGEGPPVLFIHGGPNSGSTWAPLIDAFEGYTCLLVDRPGTGLSEPIPTPPSPESFMAFAAQFVNDLADGLDIERTHVVASSLGGHIALRSAARTPERFDRMVQMACPALVDGMLMPPFMRMMTKSWFRRILGVLPPSAKANDTILRQIGHGKTLDTGGMPQVFTDWYLDLQRYTDTMTNDGHLIGSFGSSKGFDERLNLSTATLASVRTPTLFLWGEDDGFGGEDVALPIVAAMQNAELEMIADSGHLPWLDFPAEIGQRTRSFLDLG